jgi:RecB family endonuclease NucS
MPIRTAIWKVGPQPELLVESSLAKEQLLEAMIIASPRLLFDEWMLIGQQEDTGYGGRTDLLAIAPDGSLVLIELKRSKNAARRRRSIARLRWVGGETTV